MNRRDFLKTTLMTTGALMLAPALPAAVPAGKTAARRVRLGIDVVAAENFARLRGERVGLVTNQAGVDGNGESTITVLHGRGRRAGVNLVALFGPEHGIYGDVPAEKIVANQRDERLGTGLPVFSLYGGTRRPTPDMLRGITKMVIDLHSPPGGRSTGRDMNMFYEKKYADHFIECWKRIAQRFKGNPAVWAYDLINEPVQNRQSGCLRHLGRRFLTVQIVDDRPKLLNMRLL